MCEYCGCQDVPAIAALTAGHDELRAVAREAAAAARSGDRAGGADAAARLTALLGPHTAIEEHGLFPAMAAEFADHVASLEMDHYRIEAALAAVADPRDPDPRWAERLDGALRELFTHILREQDGLFPAALSVLTADEWVAIDDARARVEAAAGRTLPARQAGR